MLAAGLPLEVLESADHRVRGARPDVALVLDRRAPRAQVHAHRAHVVRGMRSAVAGSRRRRLRRRPLRDASRRDRDELSEPLLDAWVAHEHVPVVHGVRKPAEARDPVAHRPSSAPRRRIVRIPPPSPPPPSRARSSAEETPRGRSSSAGRRTPPLSTTAAPAWPALPSSSRSGRPRRPGRPSCTVGNDLPGGETTFRRRPRHFWRDRS